MVKYRNILQPEVYKKPQAFDYQKPGFLYTFSQTTFLDLTLLNITFDMGAITEALIRKRVLIGRTLNQINPVFLLLSCSQQSTLPHTAQDIVAYNAAAFAVVAAAVIDVVAAVAVFLT